MKIQRYVSKELFHFVGRSCSSDDERYDLLIKIIKQGWLTPPPHRINEQNVYQINPKVNFDSPELLSAGVVCFCDIPFADLAIHCEKYSKFGISFNRKYLVTNGAIPVHYIPVDSTFQMPVDLIAEEPKTELIPDDVAEEKFNKKLNQIRSDLNRETIPYKDIFNTWYNSLYKTMIACNRGDISNSNDNKNVNLESNITSLMITSISYILPYFKFFDSESQDTDPKNYYLEREWRILGSLSFRVQDICRIVIPEEFSSKLKNDLPSFNKQLSFL